MNITRHQASMGTGCGARFAVTAVALLCHSAAAASQAGQDAILSKLLAAVGHGSKKYVEFGFDSNEHCSGGGGSNTCALAQQGWTGLLMDGNHDNGSINLHRHLISSRNIVHLLHKYDVPLNVDFISADIDSADLWVVKAILSHGFRPRLFQVEYNSHYPWTAAITFPDPSAMATNLTHWHDKNCASGASARALATVFDEFDYVPVAISPGLDLFFVLRGVAAANNVPTIDLSLELVELHFHLPMTASDAIEMIDYSAYKIAIAQGALPSQAHAFGQLKARDTILGLINTRPLTCAHAWRNTGYRKSLPQCFAYRKKKLSCWARLQRQQIVNRKGGSKA